MISTVVEKCFKGETCLFLHDYFSYMIRSCLLCTNHIVKEKEVFVKRIKRYSVFLFSVLLFSGIFLGRLRESAQITRLTEDTVFSMDFRSQPLDEEILQEAEEMDFPGEMLGICMLETDFGRTDRRKTLEQMREGKNRWEQRPGWDSYVSACRAVWDDLEYFPVAEASNRTDMTVSFVNSWMFDRDYGGSRQHEGTDIMPSVDERGLYPVVSMTDGTVRSMGWLELGGWRIGIDAPGGAYFYYAHLASYADLKEGDQVEAGDLLGYMGDSGYSTVEGTTGNFPVHLHLGIYLYDSGQEISVNPYPVLKYTEQHRIRYRFSQ